MKNVIFLFLIGITITSFISCNKSNDIIPPDTGVSNGKIISTATIGAEGGTLSTPEVTIDIPKSSISTSAIINVIEAVQNYGGTTQFSKAYTIEGLPQGFKGILSVKVKYSKPLQNNSYVSAYFTTTPKSVGHPVTSFNYFDAKDSSGFLVSSIDFGSGTFGLGKLSGASDTKITVTAASGIEKNAATIADSNTAFTVYREANTIPLPWVIKLNDALIASSALYSTIGFKYTARSSTKPFPIYIINEPTNDDFGFYSRGFPWTMNGSYITINYAKVQSDDDIRSIAAHEFLHFAQSCYNLSDDATLWYQEALTTYSEELIQPVPATFYSTQFLLYYNRPFFGIEAGKYYIDTDVTSVKPARHGYGMGVFIKELIHNSTNQDPTVLFKLVNAVGIGKSVPVEAIKTIFPDYVDVWKNYLNKFITGKVPFIKSATIREEPELDPQRTRTWSVAAAADTMKTYAENMYDLSANVYRIHLNRTFDDFEDLKIISAPTGDKSEIEVSVYKYKNANNSLVPEFVTQSIIGKDTTIISDLKGIKSSYTSLLVLVTNRHAVTPYDGKRALSLTFKTSKQDLIASLHGANEFNFNAYGTSTNYYFIGRPVSLSVWKFGWSSPTSFSTSYSDPHQSGSSVEIKTTLNGSLSSDGKILMNVVATNVISKYNISSLLTSVETTELTANNLPYTGFFSAFPGAIAVYAVDGTSAQNHISKYHYKKVSISYATGPPVETIVKEVTSTSWLSDSRLSFIFQKR